jgi:hypothetical protein
MRNKFLEPALIEEGGELCNVQCMYGSHIHIFRTKPYMHVACALRSFDMRVHRQGILDCLGSVSAEPHSHESIVSCVLELSDGHRRQGHRARIRGPPAPLGSPKQAGCLHLMVPGNHATSEAH